MENRLSPIAFLLLVIGFVITLLNVSILLPHNKYYRYQAHHSLTTRQADWVYERLHFDTTPIDIALIGTSRMLGAISAPIVEAEYCQATGRRIHVANLAIPVTGRNMHYAIAKETATAKSPALTLVEFNEVESRRPHVGFIFLADASDILTAPLALNMNYVSDLFRLPGRQASLFLKTLVGAPDVRPVFSPKGYEGSNRDLTQEQVFISGEVKSRDITRTENQMRVLSDMREANVSPMNLLPGPLQPLEYRFVRHYLRKTEAAANNLAYLYLPAFGAPAPAPALIEELQVDHPIIDLGGPITSDHRYWLDATHHNAKGARLQSERLARRLVQNYPALGHNAECD
ncbi:MAG: hypothetical protein AAGB02_09355 [Pseudomonadota bacterium]